MSPPYGGSFAAGADVQAAIFTGEGEATANVTAFQPVDLSRETNAVMTLSARVRFDRALVRPVRVSMAAAGETAAFDVSDRVAAVPYGEWLELRVPLACFAQGGLDMTAVGTPFGLTVSEAISIEIQDIRLTERAPGDSCPDN
jgi:beta-glucosidase